MAQRHIIDAKGKTLGRVATEIARYLRGKDRVDFSPATISPAQVIVVNARYIRMSGKKFTKKSYLRYTGYPSGLRSESFSSVFLKRPDEVMRRAVYGMLPKNRLRAKMLRQLKIYHDDTVR